MTSYGYGFYGADAFGGANYPVFIDEVAFASNPLDSPQIWTDLTSRTALRSWSRGRQSERDIPDTGTSSTTFENSDRALDPVNAASVYSPNVLPMRRIRCRAFVGTQEFDVYSNFIDPESGWQLNQLGPAQVEAIVAANDGFDILSTFKFDVSAAFPQQYAGQRVAAILDAYGWPAAERDVDLSTNGQSQVQAAAAGSLSGVSALDAIQAATANDNGIFYIDGSGYAIFRGRHRLTDTRYAISQVTFSDASNWVAGYFMYTTATPLSSKIVNDYRVTRAGGTEMAWSDPTSISSFGDRTQEVATLHISDAEALNYAQYRVALDKDPHRRYDEMVIEPAGDPTVWLMLFNLQIGDRVTVIQSPPGGGAPDVRDMHVEAIKATVGPGTNASWTLRLSPVNDQIGWVLGDAVYGVLGSTTVLTY